MNKVSFAVATPDFKKIAATIYFPEKEIKGHLHILHGMSEHSARYESFALFLVAKGFVVSMHDHRGHGQTARINNEPLGHFADAEGSRLIISDVDTVLNYIQQHYTLTMRPTLLGHSMGSFIARRYMQLYSEKLSSVILMGTGAYSLLQQTGIILAQVLAKKDGARATAHLLNKLSFGNFNARFQEAKTDFDWLSSDEYEVRKYIEDPLCGQIPTNQFYIDFLQGNQLLSKVKEVDKIRKDLPILLVSGKEDPVGDFGKGVWKVAQQYYHSGITHVAVYLFENQRHEILNEKNKEIVYETILKWLEKKKCQSNNTM